MSTPLSKVDHRAAPKLAKSRDLHTIGDLMWFLPRRYKPRHRDLSDLVEGAYVVVVGEVAEATTRQMKTRRQRMLNAVITDGTHHLNITFFRAYGHERELVPGALGVFAGTVSRYKQSWQLAHPTYKIFAPEEAEDRDALARPLVPVYLEVPGVPFWAVGVMAGFALDLLGEAEDPLPADVRRRRALPGLLDSFRMAHVPRTWEDTRRAMRRFRYDEALTLQTVLAQRRLANEQLAAVPRQARPGGLLEAFDARLPFELTAGQREVGKQLADDLARDHPMHRLFQGEVGSGKTIVALRAILSVIDSGGQAALLAPTEVLAAQHFRSITTMLGDLAEGGLLGGSQIGTTVALLTGGQPAAIRRRALLDAASGEAGIVVGTHALIQEQVQFLDLGLVVVDEQHRFGVEQRDALRGKAKLPPHVLVMTATPIPRTVAMTVFGDMETSTLTELPVGRSPIATHVVANPRWLQRTWERVAEEVARGHQAYVVCPRIGEDDDVAAGGASTGREDLSDEDLPAGQETEGPFAREQRSVLEMEQELRGNRALAGLRIEVLHGRMATEVKDETMRAFSAGDIDVLVATTVIEVGVDVPNATVMVILDADRFGISQLHQLRGRVGRGSAPGLCLLVSDVDSEGVIARLGAVAGTTDGFALARLDLEHRREGDVLGARQSGGKSQLRLLRLVRDEDLILAAREDAFALVAQDPTLSLHPLLAERVASALDEEQAAYLERG